METMLDGWTDTEQAVAREAFDRAYNRAVQKLVAQVRAKADELDSADTVWQLHDYLSIEGRFDFRLDGILFVFASLVKDSLLQIDELNGLEADKLAKIVAMSRF
jgi:phosphoenolpyruvate synthase/pyruvate phosphate dikinase